MKTKQPKNYNNKKTDILPTDICCKAHDITPSDEEVVMLATTDEEESGNLQEAEKRARYFKWYKSLSLQDKKYLQLLKWYDNPDAYREWCEVGHEITMLCQMLDLAFQDFEKLGGVLFADLQLHKNAVKSMNKMVDFELNQWTMQGDEKNEQWVSMLGAAQALRERFSIIMNYSFGDKAEWRLHEFEKVIDNAYPQSAREEETRRRREELVKILADGHISQENAEEAISTLKKQSRWIEM